VVALVVSGLGPTRRVWMSLIAAAGWAAV
jgi:hypothetical protein